jgi:YidC/Oxa1 family membrane protein insertase
MKIALNGSLVSSPLDLEGFLAKAAQYGYEGADVGLEQIVALDPDDPVTAGLALFAKHGVQPSAWGLPLDFRNMDSDEGYRASLLEFPRLAKLASSGIFGWVDPVSEVMLYIFQGIHWLVHSWVLAIMLLTVVVRTCMYPVQKKMTLNSHKMAKLAPELRKLQAKYKGSKEPAAMQKMMAEQQALYKKHGVNMWAGCLPALINIPIFFGLYSVFMRGFELRQASALFGWIPDLSLPDQTVYWTPITFSLPLLGVMSIQELNVLPIIYTALLYFQMKLTPMQPAAGDDEKAQQQQKVMRFMMKVSPFIFFFFLYRAPSGLSLYYIVNSLLYFAEHKYIMWKFMPKEGTPAARALAAAAEAKAAAAAEAAKQQPAKDVKAPLPWMSKKMQSGQGWFGGKKKKNK